MKVKDAKKEINNIQNSIDMINHMNDELVEEYIISDIRNIFPNAEWRTLKLHIINSMCAYKNVLTDKINNAEIN